MYRISLRRRSVTQAKMPLADDITLDFLEGEFDLFEPGRIGPRRVAEAHGGRWAARNVRTFCVLTWAQRLSTMMRIACLRFCQRQ